MSIRFEIHAWILKSKTAPRRDLLLNSGWFIGSFKNWTRKILISWCEVTNSPIPEVLKMAQIPILHNYLNEPMYFCEFNNWGICHFLTIFKYETTLYTKQLYTQNNFKHKTALSTKQLIIKQCFRDCNEIIWAVCIGQTRWLRHYRELNCLSFILTVP